MTFKRLAAGLAAAGLFAGGAVAAYANPDWTMEAPAEAVAGSTLTITGLDCDGQVNYGVVYSGVNTDGEEFTTEHEVFEDVAEVYTLIVPADISEGTATLNGECVFTDEAGEEQIVEATGTTTITADEAAAEMFIEADPASFQVGEEIQISAGTFTPGAEITLEVVKRDGSDEVVYSMTLGTADDNGQVVGPVTFPESIPFDHYNVQVSDPDGNVVVADLWFGVDPEDSEDPGDDETPGDDDQPEDDGEPGLPSTGV